MSIEDDGVDQDQQPRTGDESAGHGLALDSTMIEVVCGERSLQSHPVEYIRDSLNQPPN